MVSCPALVWRMLEMELNMRCTTKNACIPALLMLVLACGGPKRDTQDQQTKGGDLFVAYICNTCHSLDGSEMYGPTLKDIHGKKITVIRGGEEYDVTVDRKYLIRSIQDPQYEKLRGFEDKTMPEPRISKTDVKLLVDYLISQ